MPVATTARNPFVKFFTSHPRSNQLTSFRNFFIAFGESTA
jgi:hypothetical protein